jgi:hypothetical protein
MEPVSVIELTEEQSLCCDEVIRWYNDPNGKQVFRIEGVAGTGKSSTVPHIVKLLDINVLYAAFTGKAALVMQQRGCVGASTIHRLIYLASGQGGKSTVDGKQKQLDELLAEMKGGTDEDAYYADVHPEVVRLREEIAQLHASAQSPVFRLNLDSPVREADLVVIDECFVGNTMIDTPTGPRPISQLRVGDKILNSNGTDTISGTSRKEASSGVQITFGGETVTCSEDHIFFTSRGNVLAKHLRPGSLLAQTTSCVRLLRDSIYSQFSQLDPSFLQSRLLNALVDASTGVQGENIYPRTKCKSRCCPKTISGLWDTGSIGTDRPHTKAKPHVRPERVQENQRGTQGQWAQTENSGRERSWSDRTTEEDVARSRTRLGIGTCRDYGRSTALLQAGRSTPDTENMHRSARRQPPFQKYSGRRRPKEKIPDFTRVDSVQFLEQGNPELDQFRDADGKLYLYDIEATRHHSFSVNGCLVHNCSMVSDDLAKDLLSFGTRVLVLGDPGQLPPVFGEGYFMKGEPDFRLTQIHRQAQESPILTLATMAREGRRIPEGVYGNCAVVHKITPELAIEADIILCGRNKTRHVNNARMRALRGFSGEFPQPCEKLVCLRNNHEKGLLNGSLWIVKKCHQFSRRKVSLTVVPEEGGFPISVLAHAQYFRQYGHTEDPVGPDDLTWVDKLQKEEKSIGFDIREAESFTYGYVLTTHKCVAPETFVETEFGLRTIDSLQDKGYIGTAEGMREFTEKHTYPEGPMLRITTRDGYCVTVTPDHKLMSWTGQMYQPVCASQLEVNQFLRLRLGNSVQANYLPSMLGPVPTDVRAKVHQLPTEMTEDFAEFLGLMVADGCIYNSGFRLVKRYRSVVDRFSELVNSLFGLQTIVLPHDISPAWKCEINSTQISDWLRCHGGLSPKAKGVPRVVLQSPVGIQAKFLRGLFEDGSVSKRDHSVELTSHAGPDMCSQVQLLLLRQGIISCIKQYASYRRVHIQGRSVQVFRDKVGFVSLEKNNRLANAQAMSDMRKRVPVNVFLTKDGNARLTGYTSRELASPEMLDFHHDQIVNIEHMTGPSMCVTVPSLGRFLQNGFDGYNSQGSQWDNVLVLDESRQFGNDSRKHLYTAITRAITKVTVKI